MQPDRRAALLEAKARALVRDHFLDGDEAALASARLAGGAALHDDRRAWLYLADDPRRALGRALAFSVQREVPEVHVLVDDGTDAGVLARRGSLLRPPAAVWRIDGRSLVAVDPAPLPVPMEPPAGVEPLVEMLRAVGADIVVEHGVILGEVRGLEVARVRIGDDGRPVLEVGVGRFDQEASAMMHGHLPTEEALARAVELVRSHRHPGAAPHPINRLAHDRWLRAQVVEDPSLVGLDALEPVAPTEPRANLKDPHPAGAVGRDANGATVLVVCSAGVDLDLVPVAADLAARERADRVLLVTPARDQVPTQRALVERLAVPAELVAVDGDWPV